MHKLKSLIGNAIFTLFICFGAISIFRGWEATLHFDPVMPLAGTILFFFGIFVIWAAFYCRGLFRKM